MSELNTQLYLSRLILNPSSRQVRSELAQPYEMHRTIMHAFDRYPAKDKEEKRNKFNVLFRADADERSGRVIVYVQATVEPDWAYLDGFKSYLLAGEDIFNPACKNVSTSYRRLCTGQILSFSLRANPTKRIAKPSKGDDMLVGKRVALIHEEEQIAWLIRKGNERERERPGGFEVLTKKTQEQNGETIQIARVNASREGKQTGYKRCEGHNHRISNLAVRFDGLLRITDASAFYETLIRGIGPAKAFGCGLMLVRKI